MNKELLIMLGAMMPMEMLINEISKHISEYKEASLCNNEERKEKALRDISLIGLLISVNSSTEGKIQNISDLMNELKKQDEIAKLSNPNGN